MKNKLKNNTEIIGPIEHNPIKPKLSFLESSSPLTEAIPIPHAIIKGTVIGPVVTPPESNDKGINSLGINNVNIKQAHMNSRE